MPLPPHPIKAAFNGLPSIALSGSSGIYNSLIGCKRICLSLSLSTQELNNAFVPKVLPRPILAAPDKKPRLVNFILDDINHTFYKIRFFYNSRIQILRKLTFVAVGSR